ncbi:MAG: HlyC/CorC family transporter [Bacteroidales bacterium]|nr:HlyC/CorC family transporter [Bacteroidales bacterium]
MEIAFISANKLKVEVDKKGGGFSARLLSRFIHSESSFISAMLVGNNIAIVVYGIAIAALLDPVFARILPEPLNNEAGILLLQTIVSTIIILIFAEYLPKAIFSFNPNRFLSFFALPVYLIYFLLYPLVLITIKFSEFILRTLFRMKLSNSKKVFDIVDMDNFLREFSPEKEDENEESREIQIFRNAIEFPDIKVRECMIPRTEVVAVAHDEAAEEIRSSFSQTGLSKILIYRESIDNIIGYVHAFDFFKKPKDIQPIIRPIMLVPETMHVNKLLKNFIQQQKSIAVVVDEFGGTSGIITIEDIMEEIFGEIDDEYDTDDQMEKQVKEGEYLFSARLEIDYLNERYNLNLPESEEYETLGGLILNHLESIPEKGQELQIPGFILRITQVSEKRIELVQVKISNS